MEINTTKEYREVLIIGNGPSAIALSYFLSGNVPYWNGCPVSNDNLNNKLEETVQDGSLFEQDLHFLSEGLEGNCFSPVSLLFDKLMHPGADLGASLRSKLKWRRSSSFVVDHLCIGETGIGGDWNRWRSSLLRTVTPVHHLELPNFPFDLFRERRRTEGSPKKPATSDELCDYYLQFLKRNRLTERFRSSLKIKSIERIENPANKTNKIWLTIVFDENRQENYSIYSDFLVLANGFTDEDISRTIVLNSARQIEELIFRKDLSPRTNDPLVIVGFDSTAISIIQLCQRYYVPVFHVFRQSIDDPELLINQNSSSIYPSFDRFREFVRNSPSEFYRCFPLTEVSSIDDNGFLCLRNLRTNQISKVKFSFISRLNENDFQNRSVPKIVRIKSSQLSIDPFTYQCRNEENLYAVGGSAGEKSVRFGQASAFVCAASLLKFSRKKPTPDDR